MRYDIWAFWSPFKFAQRPAAPLVPLPYFGPVCHLKQPLTTAGIYFQAADPEILVKLNVHNESLKLFLQLVYEGITS